MFIKIKGNCPDFFDLKSVRRSKHLLRLNFFLLYPLFPFTKLKRFHFNKKYWSISNHHPREWYSTWTDSAAQSTIAFWYPVCLLFG
jgi:hypothetical protein